MLYAGQDYCSACGSQWVDYRLTPKRITAEFTDRYLGTDNVFLVTILALLRYPEDVINGYIVGQRKKYVNPINLYFISLTLVGLQIFILKNFYPDILGITEAVEASNFKDAMNIFYDYLGLFTTFFIPAYAITGLIIFLDIKKYNFSEHMIFYIYVFGLSNIFTACFTPFMIGFDIPYSILSMMFSVLSIVQISWYYKRCFKLTMGQTILKVLLAIMLFPAVQLVFILFFTATVLGFIYLFQPEWLAQFNVNVK